MMQEPAQFVVLAGIDEVLGALMALLVPLLWVVKQIAEAARQAKERDAAQAAAAHVPAEAPAPPQPAGQQADPLRNQVEEFLRRAGRVSQKERGSVDRSEIEVLVGDEPVAPRRLAEPLRPGAKGIRPLTPKAPQAASPAPQREPAAPRKRKSLAERATERAAARAHKLAEQTAHLGQRIKSEDEQFDVQLKAKFDHTVGTLTSGMAGSEAAAQASESTAASPAAQIAAMLASPEGVRQAIVVNEILRPPVDRW